MDPLTHALTGATIAWAAGGHRLGRRSLLIGAAAGLLPDVDVFIRSAADPLLAIEHHRGFTHSLLLTPVGGAVAALPFVRGVSWRWGALAGVLAYLSHPLLDAATTYGTRLFWPFSRHRVGLDIISIIDPLFTLIVLIATIAAWRGRRVIVTVAMLLACAMLVAGFVQRERATAAQARLAAARGEPVQRAAVFPTFGNNIVWRAVYETGGLLRIDRMRVPWFGDASYAAVAAIPLVTDAGAGADARIRRDFDRFAWFSDRWLARAPDDPAVIGDARYSLRTDRYDPVWGIRFHPAADPPTEWVNRTANRDIDLRKVWREIVGEDAAFRALP